MTNLPIDFKSLYYPGKLVVLTNELFNKQKISKDENMLKYWEVYTGRFFNESCTYSVIMNRDNRSWTFSKCGINYLDSGYKTLPLVFKSKFEENLTIIGAYLENPEEYSVSDGKYLIIIPNFTLMEKYSDNLVITNGSLRIVYDKNFKIQIFELVSKEHQEFPTKDPNSSLVNEFGITPQFSRTLIVSNTLTLDLRGTNGDERYN
jgi:hypothetical protein